MANILSKLKDEKGQSAVEFALVAILLFLLVFGIVEFGRAWYRADLLKNAANIAARTCAVAKVQQTAINAGAAAIPNYSDPPTHIDVPNCATLAVGSSVTATVTEPFITLVPGLLPMLKDTNGNDITLTRTATYRLEP